MRARTSRTRSRSQRPSYARSPRRDTATAKELEKRAQDAERKANTAARSPGPGVGALYEKAAEAWLEAGRAYAAEGNPTAIRQTERIAENLRKKGKKLDKPVKPTDTNLFVLSEHFEGRTRAPSRIEAVSFPHLQRCMQAGLCEAEGSMVVLTPKGEEAVATYRAKRATWGRARDTDRNHRYAQLVRDLLSHKIVNGSRLDEIDSGRLNAELRSYNRFLVEVPTHPGRYRAVNAASYREITRPGRRFKRAS